MLALRPNCECCDRDLPPDSDQARICTFECTFCADCVESRLGGACPNCGGGFAPRPIRPAHLLAKYPPSTERVRKAHAGCAA
ncbi:MAG: DUF1272 domain-containing protein [Phenylobacterium sp.]|uniref:DUF1272 domain-containing protein n=1 Tax=Phenylobacterium sp. TaxID=1871053 RepID=UPI00391DFE1C